VEKGVMRQEAYGWVQRCALPSAGAPAGFKDRLKADQDIARHLAPADVDRLCSLEAQLGHVDAIFRRVLV
jgi:adenylosuccinate lyase